MARRGCWVALGVASVIAGGCRRPRTATIGYSVGAYGLEAVRVARDAIGATGRPGDPAISIVYDSLGSGDAPDTAINEARRFLTIADLVAVVGPGGSRVALVVAPVYNDAHVPHIPPTSTSRLVGRAGPWTLALAPNDSIEGEFIARYVAERLHSRRVDLFYENDEYGDGLRAATQAALRRRGVMPLYDAPVDTSSDIDAVVAAALVAGVPDAVVSGCRTETTARVALAFRRHGHPIRVVAGDGALPGGLPRLAGDLVDSLNVVSFWSPDATDSVSRAFVARFQRLLGRLPDGSEALNHDAIMVIVAAVRAVGPDRAAVRRYLLSLGRERPPYRGVTGPITFGTPAPARLVMLRFTHGAPAAVADFQ